jgi:hypothetical protein
VTPDGSADRIRGSAFLRPIAAAFIAFAVLPESCSPAPAVNGYGTRVSFSRGRPLKFPDFVLEYVGNRRVSSKQYPRGFLYRDFTVSSGSERIGVSWTAGTGDIGPTPFTVGGKRFGLELVRSDSLGPLKPNELVITAERAVPR